MLNELCVAAMQVDEVGGGDLPEMADFRGAFAAEMEDWARRSGSTTCCGARRSRHGPCAEAWRVGGLIGVYRRPMKR